MHNFPFFLSVGLVQWSHHYYQFHFLVKWGAIAGLCWLQGKEENERLIRKREVLHLYEEENEVSTLLLLHLQNEVSTPLHHHRGASPSTLLLAQLSGPHKMDFHYSHWSRCLATIRMDSTIRSTVHLSFIVRLNLLLIKDLE